MNKKWPERFKIPDGFQLAFVDGGGYRTRLIYRNKDFWFEFTFHSTSNGGGWAHQTKIKNICEISSHRRIEWATENALKFWIDRGCIIKEPDGGYFLREQASIMSCWTWHSRNDIENHGFIVVKNLDEFKDLIAPKPLSLIDNGIIIDYSMRP